MPLLAGLGGLMPMVIILIVFLGLMSFTTRRNMKKQQAARKDMENSMVEGARVMLTSGIFGTLTHVGDKQAIVELAPGAEIVVVKQAINKVVSPADEEFSFAGETAEPAPVDSAAPQVAPVETAPVESAAAESGDPVAAQSATGDPTTENKPSE
ncbi:preprotein translocase subunit YajC [Acidipropionibacterium jensenii]|uniref:Preprotein translocase subunit YajC n=1 Tax=Acidipropionibacterium jensenii TaxID=1749 RepID=A0A3S4UPI9_9ACTN|nr:preprotein translocase subunit YajC [Acidipropionibacterium jensenii]MDN5977488.1 preprotein translocase subunit YajC [Acidipropionibacterium jensenii]MDN5995656.1 preprotein translocase subunit YajC [Acidipropionibacterium jensenii]MDN6427232.1 preprotein translocase subunit YajC [Acidipropionibacterium jensenii]MDN6480557.1 preprotein translocase subunit YajC [Acidipropionibacterium jensenii]MDN6512697.1 preprotein translocase subunit YajC [Acidipropionibacterium jensenii]